MQLKIKPRGLNFCGVWRSATQEHNDGRQKADRETGAPLRVTALMARDETRAEIIKVTTAGEPWVTKRQLVTVVRLVATPWKIDDRGEVAF